MEAEEKIFDRVFTPFFSFKDEADPQDKWNNVRYKWLSRYSKTKDASNVTYEEILKANAFAESLNIPLPKFVVRM